MKEKVNKYILAILLLTTFNIGCSEEQKAASNTELPSTEPEKVEGVEEKSPLYLKLGVQWEGDTGFKFFDACALPSDAPVGAIKPCIITIPEAQLYYSTVTFRIGTTAGASCPVLKFSPYYYLRSISDKYTPPGGDKEIDCSTADKEAQCYGGAAPVLLGTEFPKNRGYYFLPNVIKETSFTLPSENKTQWYKGYAVNYAVTNDLVDTITAVLPNYANRISVNERAGSAANWVDYKVTCNDIWGKTLYTLNLQIRDENQSGNTAGPDDQYKDWF